MRFASLKFGLNHPDETDEGKGKEAPMKQSMKIACSSLFETIWALGVAIASGLVINSGPALLS